MTQPIKSDPIAAFVDTDPNTAEMGDGAARDDGREGTRRRRRRGGRGRNRGEGADGVDGNSAAEATGEQVDQDLPVAAPMGATALAAPSPAAAAVASEQPIAVAAPLMKTAAAAPVPAPSPAPVTPTVSAAKAEPYVLPIEALAAVASSAGLEWVQSDGDKIRAVQDAMAREPKPAHVPRAPKPPVVVDDGPLILVETKKDLSQIKLPFDRT